MNKSSFLSIFLICCAFGCLSYWMRYAELLREKYMKNRSDTRQAYIYSAAQDGFFSDDVSFSDDSLPGLSEICGHDGVVNNAYVAYLMGRVHLQQENKKFVSDLYNPYYIEEDSEAWYISAHPNRRIEGGVIVLSLDKKTGALLFVDRFK